MVLQWGQRVAILGLFVAVVLLLEFEVFGVGVRVVEMTRSPNCAVEWIGENVCHLWCDLISYHKMPRMNGKLLEFCRVRRDCSGAGQRSGC